MIEHGEVQGVLHAMGCEFSASECHGLLCGLICTTTPGRAKTGWFREVLNSAGLVSGELVSHAEGLKLLDRLYEWSLSGLNAADLDFRMLLPPESQSVDDRFVGLADWCSGFCLGFGLNGPGQKTTDVTEGTARRMGDAKDPLPADTAELLDDFSNIARTADKAGTDPNAGGFTADLSDIEEDIDASDRELLDEGDPESEEADQASLVELEEYVRVGTLLIVEEMRPVPSNSQSVH